MRTRFAPVRLLPAPPDDNVTGVHLDLGGIHITGMTPKYQDWGGRIWFTKLTGWWDTVGSTGQTTQYALADGGWNDAAFRTPRVVEVEGILEGPTRASVRDGLDRLMAAIPLDAPAPLVVTEDGLQRYCMVRMSGDPTAEWERGPNLYVTWNIQVVAGDPRRLAGTSPDDGWVSYGPVGTGASEGGVTFPVAFPFPINAVQTPNAVELDIQGTGNPDVLAVITGPVGTPAIVQADTGRRLWFDLELGASDVLTVDLSQGSSARRVLLNGVSRRGAARGEWPVIQSGRSYRFEATGIWPEATMTFNVKDAWI